MFAEEFVSGRSSWDSSRDRIPTGRYQSVEQQSLGLAQGENDINVPI